MKKIIVLIIAVFCFGNGYSQTADDYLNSGLDKEILKDFKGAMADYNKSIELNQNNKFALYMRANLKLILEDNRGAIQDYNIIISSIADSSKAEPYYNRGVAKANIDDKSGAIEDFTKAIEIDSNYAIRYYARGLTKLLLNQKNNACLDFSKAGELGSEDAYEMIKKHCN